MKTYSTSKTVTLVELTCPECSGIFAINQEWQEEARRLGEFKLCWCCPYCKAQRGYGTNPLMKMQERAEAAEKRAREEQCRAINAQAALDAKEKEIRRHKKRSAAGTCPCCQRTFSQMARHMKTCHPEFVKEHTAK